ncbi:FUSC family protein [Ralstonia pseudosolanacearum]|uniref:FUSC family protein n=1 Tax=Ralstonia pseudosolanacearum TaxID=1310165 RepID=UPI002003CE23|nr:FUSC family protein [Ralstonia pseudosolanacearum]MCK4155035.1 FUSC family protein [Ralstonia pseudosolanacearum]
MSISISLPRAPKLPAPLLYALRLVRDPHRRYRYARYIHGTRVGLGVLLSIAVTSGLGWPHGEWATISLLIVIAGLQHHGNIRKRAAERAWGTLIGALAGLLLIVQQTYLGHPPLTYALMGIACGICAYHAIGKGGYIALLAAITLVIVVGHGDNDLLDGAWRTLNVLVGIAIALLFSFALPLYATYSWRYRLADALRECAKVYASLSKAGATVGSEPLKHLNRLNALLVQLRSLMPSVSKEIEVPIERLERIQHSLRICISTLELLGTARASADAPAARATADILSAQEDRRIRDTLIGISRALRFGTVARLAHSRAADAEPAASLPGQLTAESALALRFASEVEQLRSEFLATAPRWNIG